MAGLARWSQPAASRHRTAPIGQCELHGSRRLGSSTQVEQSRHKQQRRKPMRLVKKEGGESHRPCRNESMKVDELQVRCNIAGHAGWRRLRPQTSSGPHETVRCAPRQRGGASCRQGARKSFQLTAQLLSRCAATTLVGRGVRALRPTGLQGAILGVRADCEVTRDRFRAQGARWNVSFAGWNWNRSQFRWAYRSSSQAQRGRLWSDHGGENGSGDWVRIRLRHAARKSSIARAGLQPSTKVIARRVARKWLARWLPSFRNTAAGTNTQALRK